jgi:hypothetical protein
MEEYIFKLVTMIALVIVLLLCRLAKSLHLGIKVCLSQQQKSISAPPNIQERKGTCTYPEHKRDQIEERDPELRQCSLVSVIYTNAGTDLRREEFLRKYERERGADPHNLCE